MAFELGLRTAVGDIALPTEGGARSVLFKAASMSKAPAPIEKTSCWRLYTVPVPKSVAVVVWEKPFQAVFINRAFTWSGVMEGFCCKSRAAAPLTTGVAMLVPLKVMYWAAPY